MLGSSHLYFNYSIENSNFIDQCANFFLSPLHDELFGFGQMQDRKVFRVDLDANKVEEVSSRKANETTFKVNKVILYFTRISFVIPVAVVGTGLKVIALLLDRKLYKQYQMLFNSLNPAPIEKKPLPKYVENVANEALLPFNYENSLKQLPKELIFKIITYLPVNQIIELERINRAWYTLLNLNLKQEALLKESLKEYRLNKKGTPQITEDTSFHSFSLDCKKYVADFHFNHPDIISLFGSLENILNLRVFKLDESDKKADFESLEKFTHDEKFAKLPSIFRLRLNWQDTGLKEFIIIKYTLFVPQEETGQADTVWHDYLWLSHTSNKEGYFPDKKDHWTGHDPRDPDHLTNNLRQKLGYPRFSDLNPNPNFLRMNYRSICSLGSLIDDTITKNQLKRLIQGKLVGFFDQGKYSRRPNYLQDRTVEGNPTPRMFKDIPMTLGHVSVDEISKHFKTVPWSVPDFIANESGQMMLNPVKKKAGDLSQIIVFE